MKDRSLDEFLDDGDESPSDPEDGDESSSAPEEGDESPSDPEDWNELVTARWMPGGAVCEECGKEVSRLWNDDGRDCCRSCKQW
jgi:hypothetical protein